MIPLPLPKTKDPFFGSFFLLFGSLKHIVVTGSKSSEQRIKILLRFLFFIWVFPGKNIANIYFFHERGVRRRSGMNFRGDLGKTAIEVYNILD